MQTDQVFDGTHELLCFTWNHLPPEFSVCTISGLLTKLCPTFCNLIDCSLPGSSVYGIFQARKLEWVAMFFSRGSSWPRDWTKVSASCVLADRFLAAEPPSPRISLYIEHNPNQNPSRICVCACKISQRVSRIYMKSKRPELSSQFWRLKIVWL